MKSVLRFLSIPAGLIGTILLTGVCFMALTADIFFPENPLALAGMPLQWPFTDADIWLGTDNVGRDIAAQIFHGARVTLAIGIVSTVIAVAVGVVVGALAGYFGGVIDEVLMRITDAFQTLPNFLLLLIVITVFHSSVGVVMIAVGLVSWPAPARLTRGEFLTLREREFVASCRLIGLSNREIIFREILPNALPPIVVYSSVVMAYAILMESALAFLNLSDKNVASWGTLIGAGRSVLRSEWYVAAIPGIAILVTVLAVSLVGQALNDMLNPRLRSR